MKHLRFKPYIDEAPTWPDRGRVILAQYDAEDIVLYAPYQHQYDFERMLWLTPSFLWMMHHSNWAAGRGKSQVAALRVRRGAFDEYLQSAVPSTFVEGAYESREAWQAALDASDVRAQWDPDFPPRGPKLNRKAFRLGLRGDALRRFPDAWSAAAEDLTAFARQQAEFVSTPELLFVPAQNIYPVPDPHVATRLSLDKSSTR